jgi:hypothetical protein
MTTADDSSTRHSVVAATTRAGAGFVRRRVRGELNYLAGGWKEKAMATEIVVLIVGFVLTTVLGGLLGSYFQRRTWDHQHEAQLRDQELERASHTCYSLSVLLDRRLYRMVRLQHAIGRCQEGGFTRDQVQARLRAYDEVLVEWNDGLNGNLAVIGTYFGEPARRFLDHDVYESFAASGKCLETAYQALMNGDSVELEQCELHRLNDLVYRLVSYMTGHLRDGTVGRSLKEATPTPSEP